MIGKKITGEQIRELENLRNRLRDAIQGDTTVDIGALGYGLNNLIGVLGGTKIESKVFAVSFYVQRSDEG